MHKEAPIGAKIEFCLVSSINRVLLRSQYLLYQSEYLTPEESPVYRISYEVGTAPWEPPNWVYYYFNAFSLLERRQTFASRLCFKVIRFITKSFIFSSRLTKL